MIERKTAESPVCATKSHLLRQQSAGIVGDVVDHRSIGRKSTTVGWSGQIKPGSVEISRGA